MIVPAIVCWEVALLAATRRIRLQTSTAAWLAAALAWRDVDIEALTPEIAVRAAGLGTPIPADPADRLIVATAAVLDVPLVTLDDRIIASGVVETVW